MTSPLLGFGLPVSGSWATAETMADVARRAEDLGYASLWTFQRLLVPAERDWGPQYRSVHDPLLPLAFAAAVTSRIRLGAAVVNLPFYPPALLAQQLASLDVLSGGRLDVGLGLGWSREEFTALGVPYERRGARLEDGIAALQALWADDPVEVESEFTRVPPSRMLPKPVQRPRPPLLLGGSAEPALRRAGRLADGWISGSQQDPGSIAAAVATVREAAEDAGRDPDELRFVVRGVVRLDDEQVVGGERRALTGTADQIRSDVAGLGRVGVTEVFLDLNFHPSVGSPDADPVAARAHADRVLETFAPAP